MNRRAWIAILLLLATCPAAPAQRRLDVTQVIVMGEGLAAGVQDFGLRSEYQKQSFPAVVARQLKTILPQPLLQGPGLAVLPGVHTMPAILPTTRQTTVREGFPPSLFVFNLSVPGLRLTEAISQRPAEPLVRTNDPKQTLINLILGYPSLVLGSGKPLWSQLEYAEAMNPTLVIVCLGYYDAADAAASGDPTRMPDAATIRNNMNSILTRLRANFAEVIVMNVPDPFDSGYFTPLESAPRYVGASPGTLTNLYGMGSNDWLTPSGLMAIGTQLLSDQPGPLPDGAVISSSAAAQVRTRVQQANAEIASAAEQNGALLYDLNGLFRQVRANGVVVGNRVLKADYLGGFYSLNGFYPGVVGQTLIANELLTLINRTYGTNYSTVNLADALADDPALRRVQFFRPKPSEAESQ